MADRSSARRSPANARDRVPGGPAADSAQNRADFVMCAACAACLTVGTVAGIAFAPRGAGGRELDTVPAELREELEPAFLRYSTLGRGERSGRLPLPPGPVL